MQQSTNINLLQTRVKTNEQYLHIPPFALKSVLSVVESYQAVSPSTKDLQPQDEEGKLPEHAVVLKKRITTVHVHEEVGSIRTGRILRESGRNPFSGSPTDRFSSNPLTFHHMEHFILQVANEGHNTQRVKPSNAYNVYLEDTEGEDMEKY